MSKREVKAWCAWWPLAVLLVVMALSGFRGEPRGNYINQVEITTNDTVLFSATSSGAASGPTDLRSVKFLDVMNTTGDVVTLTIYSQAAPNDTSFTAKLPANASESWSKVRIDSIGATGVTGSILFNGAD